LKYLLDTNAVAALMRGEERVVQRLKRITRRDVSIAQPVVAEIEYGIERLPKSKRRDALIATFELLKDELQRMPWSDEVSEAFGRIKATLERRGERLEDFDIAVAAHAVAAGSILVTANIKHLLRVPGLEVEDWSKA
jgi:tRNA(fMet)-specific endonuclease VapC